MQLFSGRGLIGSFTEIRDRRRPSQSSHYIWWVSNRFNFVDNNDLTTYLNDKAKLRTYGDHTTLQRAAELYHIQIVVLSSIRSFGNSDNLTIWLIFQFATDLGAGTFRRGRRTLRRTTSTGGYHRRCSIPQRTRSKAISLAGSSFGSRGTCGAWLSSAMLTLVIVVIVFIVGKAPNLVLLVKKLLGVSGWYSDVWCKVEVGSLKKGGVWLPVLQLRHLRQCQTSTPTC